VDRQTYGHAGRSIVSTLACMQAVCWVSREWSKERNGRRTLSMSRRCSTRHDCTPGWTSWPYTDDHIYDHSAAHSSDSSHSSDESSDGSDDSDDESSYWLYQPYSYSYFTVHTSCPATSCHAPTGKLDHFDSGSVVVSVVRRMNEVILHRARLVLPGTRMSIPVLEFCTPCNISATANARDFKFCTRVGRVKS